MVNSAHHCSELNEGTNQKLTDNKPSTCMFLSYERNIRNKIIPRSRHCRFVPLCLNLRLWFVVVCCIRYSKSQTINTYKNERLPGCSSVTHSMPLLKSLHWLAAGLIVSKLTDRADALRRAAPRRAAPRRAAPRRAAPRRAAPRRAAPRRAAPRRAAPHRTAPHHTTPHHVIHHDIISYSIISTSILYVYI